MKKLLNITIIIVTVVFITSCRKITGNTDVSGTIYNEATMAPVPYAHLSLLRTKSDCRTCGFETVMDVIAGADGSFSFNFKASRNYSYVVDANANHYISGGTSVDSYKNNNNKKILMIPEVYLKLHVKNASPFNGSDQVNVEYNHSGASFLFNGATIDTTIISTAEGGKNNTIYWFVQKNSITTNYNASVYCSPIDTTSFDINY